MVVVAVYVHGVLHKCLLLLNRFEVARYALFVLLLRLLQLLLLRFDALRRRQSGITTMNDLIAQSWRY